MWNAKVLRLYVHRNRRFIRDGSPGRPPRLSHSSWDLNPTQLKCCFTSTETVGLLGTGALDVHLNFHTAPELWRRFCKRGDLYIERCHTTTTLIRHEDGELFLRCFVSSGGHSHYKTLTTIAILKRKAKPRRMEPEFICLPAEPDAFNYQQTNLNRTITYEKALCKLDFVFKWSLSHCCCLLISSDSLIRKYTSRWTWITRLLTKKLSINSILF